jgi:hypothetical protein
MTFSITFRRRSFKLGLVALLAAPAVAQPQACPTEKCQKVVAAAEVRID